MTVSPAALRTAQHDYAAQSPDAVERLVPPASSAEVSGRIRATVRQGVDIAAHDGDAEVRTFLADDKKVAMLAGGVGIVAGAQLVPGVDVAVDAGLGITAAAMYAAAGAAHRDRIGQAVGSLHAYATEVAAADTPERQAHAAQDFARFLEVGGGEGADALGAIAGAASAPAMLAGVAAEVTELGGLDGVLAAAKNGAHAAHASVTNGIRAAADRLAQTPTVDLRLATPQGVVTGIKTGDTAEGRRFFAGRGERIQQPTSQAIGAGKRIALLPVEKQKTLERIGLPSEGEMPFEPPPYWSGSRRDLVAPSARGPGYRDAHGNVWLKGESRTRGEHREWDVQIAEKSSKPPAWIKIYSKDGDHINVSFTGKATH